MELKLIKGLVLSALLSTSAVAIDRGEVAAAFNQVKAQVGDTAKNTIVAIPDVGPIHTEYQIPRNADEAEAPYATVFMPEQAARELTNDEAMLILGHELGHIQYNIMMEKSAHSREIAADIFGMMILAELGFSKARLMKTIEIVLATGEGGESHPSGKKRYQELVKAINLYFS